MNLEGKELMVQWLDVVHFEDDKFKVDILHQPTPILTSRGICLEDCSGSLTIASTTADDHGIRECTRIPMSLVKNIKVLSYSKTVYAGER